MGTKVLPAKDCLIQTKFHRRQKPCSTTNRTTNPKRHTNNNDYHKLHATGIKRSDLMAKHQNKKQCMQVTNLKRIEPRASSNDSYAGSGFVLSPSPRCLPFPSFFSKKRGSVIGDHDDVATKDLRRMLRLE